MKTERFLVEAINEQGEVVGGWEDDGDHCSPYYGYCGGCSQCLEMQAHYAGLTITRFRIRWWHQLWWRIRLYITSWFYPR